MREAISRLRAGAKGVLCTFFTLAMGGMVALPALAVTSQSFKVSATIVPGC